MEEPELEHHVVEAGFEKLQQDLARDAAGLERRFEIAAELAFEQSVLIAELLFLGERERVLRLLAASATRAVHSGGVVLAFESFGGTESGTP